MSAAAKLVGFVLLLIAVFLGAHAAGAHLGPVTTSQSQSAAAGSPSRRRRVDAHGRPAVSDAGELAGGQVELVVSGMSCGSCAARIERRLNRLDGVVATVNFATERAYIASTGGRDPDELISVIESVGYRASRPAPAAGSIRPRMRRRARCAGGWPSAGRWPPR